MKSFLKRFIALRMVRSHKSRENAIDELEKRHFNKYHSNYNDSIYFAGLNKDGFSFVSRMAFRNGKHNENWLKISIPGEGVWGFENLELKEGENFKQGELKYCNIEPGELWEIEYQGLVYQGNKHYQIEMKLKWHSITPIADFDNVGTSYEQVAFQLATKKWNPRFFKKIREILKVHYEQAGNIIGTITWKRKKYDVQLRGFRDHSYGNRNWIDWGRNLWLIGMLNDGRFFNISIVDYDFIKNLKAGFLWNRREYHNIAFTPSFGSLKLIEPLPGHLSFNIKETENSAAIPINIDMKTFFPFTMDGVYHIRQAEASVEWGGIKGIGIAEMGINLRKYNVII